MNDYIAFSAYFGAALTLLVYVLANVIGRRLNHPLANPMLICLVLMIALLLVLDIDYDAYNQSAQYITYLLTPATACLALPLYRQIQKLREYPLAIAAGIVTGVVVNALCVTAVALLFWLGHSDYVTLLPKSVTGTVGMPLAEELGGIGGITMAAISVTGLLGNILGEQILRLFRVTDRVAKGVALGCGSHAFGTVRALELGEVEGAMASLSLVITALLTVVIAPLLGNLL